MLTLSNADQSHMKEHLQDVWFVRMQVEGTGNKLTLEEAYLSWAEHSRREGRDWIDIDRNHEMAPDILAAHRDLKRSMAASSASLNIPARRSERDYEVIGSKARSEPHTDRTSRDLAEHVEGRISNIAYMANEMDRRDGIPEHMRAPSRPGGKQQFDHLEQSFSKQAPGIDRVYVALRRLQRAGKHDMVAAGATLLALADKGGLKHTDVLASIGQDGVLPDRNLSHDKDEPIMIRSKGLERSESESANLLQHPRDFGAER